MAKGPPSEDPDLPPWLLAAGSLFGWNKIQTRWKLNALARKWRSFRSELAPTSRRFEHQICPECGALQDYQAKTCSSCNERLQSAPARFFRTIGFSVPSFISASSLLGAACIIIYFRMMLAYPGQGLMGWEGDAVFLHGGLWPPAFFEGQWWRVGTANFLHLSVMHIVFNTIGLSQIGPAVEDVFGRARMVFFFAITGVLAFTASAYFMPNTPTAGASGSLMGLVGVAAGWGHRRGTSEGKAIRDHMLKWGLYTMLFGLLLRANHVAHAVGFISGALIGLAYPPESLQKTRRSVLSMGMGVVGSVACIVFVMIALFPPQASRAYVEQHFPKEHLFVHDSLAGEREFKAGINRACELWDAGKQDDALVAARSVTHPKLMGVEVVGTCMYVKHVREHCPAYREGGLEAVLEPGEKENAKARETTADYYRLWCNDKE
jgi:rhomboid protease GluP